MSVAQFRHGPVEVVDEQFHAIVFGTQPRTAELDHTLAERLQDMGAHVRSIGPEWPAGKVVSLCAWPEDIPERCVPLVDAVPVQIAAYETARWHGLPIGELKFATPVTLSEHDFAHTASRSGMIDWFPLWLSLRVAALATLFVLTIGTLLAYLLSHKSFRGKNLVDSLITLPLVLPPTVLGYYLLVMVGRHSPLGHLYEGVFGQPLVFTWQAAVVAAFLHSAPIYIKAGRAVLETVDTRYEWAAHSLGASEWRTFGGSLCRWPGAASVRSLP